MSSEFVLSHCKLDITKDEVWAYLSIEVPFRSVEDMQYEIKSLLDEQGVVYGVIDEQLAYLAPNSTEKNILIAKGTYPVDGENARIEYHFDVKHQIAPHKNKDGSINLKELGYVEMINKDAILVRKIPAMNGKEGMTVKGEVIEAKPGMDIMLTAGNNCYISENGLEIRAKKTGALSFDKGIVSVQELIEINDDVGVSTGNIYFDGDVVVHGDIKDGMSVICQDLIVDGVVEGATVKVQGNVFVDRGISGHNQARIEAKGNIVCKYISNSEIVAGGNIETGAILNSEVKSNGHIAVEGKKGCIIGGRVFARDVLKAKVLGSELGVSTVVYVGIAAEEKERLRQMTLELGKLNKKLKEIEQSLVVLSDKAKTLSENHRYILKLESYLKDRREIKKRIERKDKEIHRLKIKAGLGFPSKLSASVIYPNVTIYFNDDRMEILEKQESIHISGH